MYGSAFSPFRRWSTCRSAATRHARARSMISLVMSPLPFCFFPFLYGLPRIRRIGRFLAHAATDRLFENGPSLFEALIHRLPSLVSALPQLVPRMVSGLLNFRHLLLHH